MSPEVTGRNYDTIAERWLDPSLQSNGLAAFERAIRFVEKRNAALDIGCGCSGRFADLLMRHGFQYEGIDVSSRMIALARERHPQVTFHEADICRWDLPRGYDFISAWDSLFHLPLEAQEPVLEKICAGLNPGGVYLFTAGGLDGPGEKADSFMGPGMEYSTLGLPRFLELLTQNGCVCRHLEYDQYPEPHVFIVAQKTRA